MPLMPFVEENEAPPEVKAVYDDIKATRKVDWVNNFWKVLANDPKTYIYIAGLEDAEKHFNKAMSAIAGSEAKWKELLYQAAEA